MDNSHNNPAILIVEDDNEQMDLLVGYALNEIKSLIDDQASDELEIQKLKDIRILKVSNISTLEKAVIRHKNIILTVLDCNIPDIKGGVPHDQLIKTNYKITGQHKSVDILSGNIPDTPITMISSLNRFRKIVTQHYFKTHGLNINFIAKSDQAMINRNIGYYIRQYISNGKETSYKVLEH